MVNYRNRELMFKKYVTIVTLGFLLTPHVDCLPLSKDYKANLKDKRMITKKLEHNAQVMTASGCTFTVEKGWYVTQHNTMIVLEEPDRELAITLIENNEKLQKLQYLQHGKKCSQIFHALLII